MIEYDLEFINDTDMKQFYNTDATDKNVEIISNSLKLTEKLWNYNDKVYKIIRYDKEYMTNDMIHTIGLFRSVIVNNENKIISFAPPKSLNLDAFKTKYSELSNLVAEEYVEGTMINLFWNATEWELSTRSTIGGKIIFFQDYDKLITFRNMFIETCNETKLEFDNLDKRYFYSFVMQHPKNRIVKPIYEKMLYLVKVYKIENYKVIDINREFIHDEYFNGTTVKLPEKYNFTSYDDLESHHCSMNSRYDNVGVMLHSNTGERSKMRNPSYEHVRKLRGNQPKLQYEYLSLRKTGNMKEFLKYYPEYKKEFNEYREQLHEYTTTLYYNYVSCYINKENPLNKFLPQFRTNMYNLHQTYINDLRPEKKHIAYKLVVEYVNNLHQSQQMHFLNYNIKKQHIDCLKADDIMNTDPDDAVSDNNISE